MIIHLRNKIRTCFVLFISCGGNVLINIGPTHDGRISPVFEERLRQMGQWLAINGEAIYESVPWTHQNDTLTPDVWWVSNTPCHAHHLGIEQFCLTFVFGFCGTFSLLYMFKARCINFKSVTNVSVFSISIS